MMEPPVQMKSLYKPKKTNTNAEIQSEQTWNYNRTEISDC